MEILSNEINHQQSQQNLQSQEQKSNSLINLNLFYNNLNDRSNIPLAKSLSAFYQNNQVSKNEKKSSGFKNSNPLFERPDDFSHPLVNRSSYNVNEEEKKDISEKNKINEKKGVIEVAKIPFKNIINKNKDSYKEAFNDNLSDIDLVENDYEESEKSIEEDEGNKKIKKNNDMKDIVSGLKGNSIIDISNDLNTMKKLYDVFIQIVKKEETISNQNKIKNKNKIKNNISKSFSVEHKKIKGIDNNIVVKNYIRSFSIGQKPKKVIRCLYTENGNYICNRFPSIKTFNDGVFFNCGKHKIKKKTNELMELSLNNKLFRIVSNNENVRKCLIHKNELVIDFCFSCMKNVCKECIKCNHPQKKRGKHILISNNRRLILKKVKSKYNYTVSIKKKLKKVINSEKSLIDNILNETKKINYGKNIIKSANKNIINHINIVIKSIKRYIYESVLLFIILEGQRMLADKKKINIQMMNLLIII